MKLGMPVLIELEGLRQNAGLCARLELQMLELSMNLPQYCPEMLNPSAVRAVSAASGLQISLHLPEEADLGTFHPPVRQGHLERAIAALRWAAEAGIVLVNMHLNAGVYYSLPDSRVYVYERQADGFRERMMDGMARLAQEAGALGITLCVENTGQFSLDFLSAPLQQLVDSGLVGLTWDTGHDGKAGFADKPFILRNHKALRHMHLHDFDDRHDHWPICTGNLNLTEALEIACDLDLSVIIEVKTARALEHSVEAVRQRLEEMGAD
jgi:sugar phosphate isomerase/epimerase